MKYSAHSKFLALASAVALAISPSANAAIMTWDFGANPDKLWSNGANWSGTPDNTVPGTGDSAVFSTATGASSAATVTSIVGTSISITNLSYLQSVAATSFHTTEINSGVTLTVAGNFTAAPATATSATTTIKDGTGAGTLTVTGSSFNVGAAGNNTGTLVTTLDLSGLSNFNYNNAAGNITVGYLAVTGPISLMKMAASNSITASTLKMGSSSIAGGTVLSEITLGSSNTWNVNTIVAAEQRQSGKISFQTGLTNAGITIRGATGGSSRANLSLGVTSSTATSTAITGTMDLTGAAGTGTVDALLGTVKLGQVNHTNASGNATGVFSFNKGTVDATSILAGSMAATTANPTVGTGTINVSGTGTLTQSGTAATDFILGQRTSATTATGTPTVASGTLNISNTALVTVNASQLTLGDNSGTGDDNVSATVNLDGGTLEVKKIAAGSNTGGAANSRTFNFNGGELKALASDTTFMQGLTTANVKNGGAKINTNGNNVTINQQLVQFAGATTDALTKTGGGTLSLTAGNTYGGGTAVNGGTLAANNTTGSATGTGAITVGIAGTLGGSGSVSGGVTVNSGGTLAPGNSIESLNSGALAFTNNSTFAIEVNSGVATSVGSDRQNVTGTLSLSGTVTLTLANLSGGTFVNGTKFTLINYTSSYTGGLFTINAGTVADDTNFTFNGQQWTLNYNDTTSGANFSPADDLGGSYVTITAVVPEPSTVGMIIGGFGILVLAQRRRRNA